MLVLELLGTLSLRNDAAPIPLAAQQKRRVGLLALLALGGRQGLSRHRIEAYLWSESSAERARHALDQAVYAIRRSLGGDVVVSTGQELRLNAELLRVDIWEFGDAIRAADWGAAAGMYRGALLDGFHFGESRELESWIDAERGRLLRDYQTAIERLADRSAHEGDHSRDVTWRRTLANSDPLSAGFTKKLILALAAAGDRAGAVKQARTYQRLVRQELEMEPDSEIEGLAASLSRRSGEHAPVAAGKTVGQSDGQTVRRSDGRTVGQSDRNDQGQTDTTRGTARSRVAAFAAFSVVAALVIATLLVTSAQRRDSRASVPGGATRDASRAPSPEARQEYLRGLTAWDDRTKEGNDRAVALFRRATEIDPEYAAAHAALAEAYVRIGYFGYRPADAMFPKAKAAALRSLQLDSTIASAHTALATELIWEHDFAGAEAEYRRTIALDPADATAHQWYGVLLMILRRIPASVAEERRASELAPLSLQTQSNYATFLNASGDHAGALRHFQKTIGEEPDSAWVGRNPWVLANMSLVYADNGQYGAAVRWMKRALEIVPRHPRALHGMAKIYAMMGRTDLAHEAFARADTSNEQYSAYRGLMYAGEGERDSAFYWFDRTPRLGIQTMLTLQADARIDPMRGDPRFRALLARLGIPSYEAAPASMR